jgi:hypothetical protein
MALNLRGQRLQEAMFEFQKEQAKRQQGGGFLKKLAGAGLGAFLGPIGALAGGAIGGLFDGGGGGGADFGQQAIGGGGFSL